MPKSTASTIISQFKKSQKCYPNPRGDSHKVFDKLKIAKFLDDYLSDTANSNSTLEEMKEEIWENRSELLSPTTPHPPSVSWICKLLSESLFDSKKITLKSVSVDPIRRNCDEVIQKRIEFVSWYNTLTDDDKRCIVWVDEHGFNLWSVRKKGRSKQGLKVTVPVATTKGNNVTIILAVSTYGKVAMVPYDHGTDSATFNSFLAFMKKQWMDMREIPDHLKEKGPIVLLDNLAAHNCVELSKTRHKFLPPYSPFLNVAEPINGDHKKGIRKLLKYYKAIPEYMEQVKRGSKGKQRVHITQLFAHIAWNEIPNSYVSAHLNHIQKVYFPKCESGQQIHY